MTKNPQELVAVEVMALALDDKYFPGKKTQVIGKFFTVYDNHDLHMRVSMIQHVT